MRVIASALAVLGCSALPVSAAVRSPVDSRCQAMGLKGCPELVEGAVAYAEGHQRLAQQKLASAKQQNSPEDLARLAAALREVASRTEAARPLAEVAAILTSDEPSPPPSEPSAPSPPPEVAPSALLASPIQPLPPRSSPTEERKAIAERLALYALTAREDPTRRVTETIELADAPGTACQVAGSEAICLRRQKGPFVVTDVVTSEECGWRVSLAVSDSDAPAPLFGFSWVVPARAQGVHGASFALRGGQWLYVAIKSAKPSPTDRACFVTWSGYRPRLVPSLAGELDDNELNPYRFRD